MLRVQHPYCVRLSPGKCSHQREPAEEVAKTLDWLRGGRRTSGGYVDYGTSSEFNCPAPRRLR